MSEKKYKTDKELQAAIDAYFETRGYDPETEITRAPTVSGLALYLGFADRQSLYDYKKDKAHSCTIKKAITRIECFAEETLLTGSQTTGAIFWLKNHRWSDKQTIELEGNEDKPLRMVSISEIVEPE